jgi:murein DD-endopeptidase MepM/ murein hydrolase activator NlpD
VPKQLIYIINAYKFEAIIVGLLSVMAVCVSFVTVVEHTYASSGPNNSIQAPYPTYPRGKASVAVNQAAATIKPQTGSSMWPIRGMVTTEFGVSHQPWQAWHTGIDISSGLRSGSAAVQAFRGGTVTTAGWSQSGYGNHVIIDHGGGLTSLYAHMASVTVGKNQPIQTGDSVGYEGSTGSSTGAHVHFEVLQSGKPLNPRGQIPGSP